MSSASGDESTTATVNCTSDACSIQVQDHGVGIPAEYVEKIGYIPISFKASKGRGLGLTHAFKVIQSWGGLITINSEVGFGTIIKIELRKESIEKAESRQSDKIC